MLISIGKVAEFLGVCIDTLRNWHKEERLLPEIITKGGHRRYDEDKLKSLFFDQEILNENKEDEEDEKLTIGYARVSSHDQKKDLVEQEKVLNDILKSKQNSVLISDLGSGINFKKNGLKQLIYLILKQKVKEIIITHKDRLLRFGFELIEFIAKFFNIKIIVLNNQLKDSFESELTKDVLTIITVFSAKLYGSRSHSNKKKLALALNS